MAGLHGKGLNAAEVRLELAVNRFDQEQISMGIAARIAGLSIGEMMTSWENEKSRLRAMAQASFTRVGICQHPC